MPKCSRKRLTAAAISRRAVERGARHAKVVSTAMVFTAPWVRWKCQFGCDGYGSSLLCPPHSPKPEETRAVLDGYKRAILIHGGKTMDIRQLVTDLEREAFLGGFYKAFGLACGPCQLCKKCALDEGCRHPERARPAMEACGIDVFKTARTARFPIDVVTDYDSGVNYYGLLLLE